VVCLVDHDGDWNALDEAIQQADKHHGEEKWSHLRDLSERLDRAGLTAADLVGATLRAQAAGQGAYEGDEVVAVPPRPHTADARPTLKTAA
jgi:hypothetical protein